MDLEYEKIGYGWRSAFWNAVIEPLRSAPVTMDIYMFGVFAGRSVIEWCNILDRIKIPYNRIICFDSFEGIPKETAEPLLRSEWDPDRSDFYGAFNATKYWNTNVEESVSLFYDKVKPHMRKDSELVIVPGFFDKSLTASLKEQLNLKPASIVDVDVDIYSSTRTLLDFMFENDLMAPGITQVGYDDWGGTPGHKQMLDGESRAHREVSERYGAEWTILTSTAHSDQVVFRYNGRTIKG
jgi:hypothetical protein